MEIRDPWIMFYSVRCLKIGGVIIADVVFSYIVS